MSLHLTTVFSEKRKAKRIGSTTSMHPNARTTHSVNMAVNVTIQSYLKMRRVLNPEAVAKRTGDILSDPSSVMIRKIYQSSSNIVQKLEGNLNRSGHDKGDVESGRWKVGQEKAVVAQS